MRVPTSNMAIAKLREIFVSRSEAGRADDCLRAYEWELDYLFETLRRLGALNRDIEDLAQEVFLVIHRKWPKFDKTRPLRPYLFGVAFRVVRAHTRRRAREIPYPDLVIEDESPGPEQALGDQQAKRLLRAALEHVPLKRRAVLVMHDLDGVSVSEIASRLSLSLFGTYARLRKGRKELTSAIRRVKGERAKQNERLRESAGEKRATRPRSSLAPGSNPTS